MVEMKGWAEEHARVGARIYQLTVARLFLLVVVVIVLTQAGARAASSGAPEAVRGVHAVFDTYGAALEQVGRPSPELLRPGTWWTDGDADSIVAQVDDPDAKLALATKLRALQTIYRQAYAIKIDVLGGAEFDIRDWVFWAPSLFVLSVLYLSLLRLRQRFVAHRIVQANRTAAADAATSFDMLMFGVEDGTTTAYATEPSTLERRLHTLAVTTLLGAALISLMSHPIGPPAILPSSLLFAAVVAFYAFAYYCLEARNVFGAEVASLAPPVGGQ
jgi:hypothetical protein